MRGCVSIIGNVIGYKSIMDCSNLGKQSVVHSMTMKSFMCGSGCFQATGTPKMQSQTDNFTILKLW
jgi:hypothetical protein